MNTLVEEQEKPKKRAKKTSSKKSSNGTGRFFASLLNGDFFSRDNLVKNIPFFFYVAFLLILYIGYGYYVEKTSSNIADLEEKSLELRADQNNENAYYNQISMYSHIEDSLSAAGILPSVEPPQKIFVSKSQFNTQE